MLLIINMQPERIESYLWRISRRFGSEEERFEVIRKFISPLACLKLHKNQ